MRNRTIIFAAAFMAAVNTSQVRIWAAQERITYESPVFTDAGKACRPEEILEQGGKQYRLISTRIRDAIGGGVLTYASASIPYTLEGRQEPPETVWITLKDDITGGEYEREVPRQEIVEKESYWSDDFQFPVTVSGYDSDYFLLGSEEIPADMDLADYGDELLQYLGLPADCYRVEDVVWNGESYENGDTLCRDAVALGSKLIRSVDVKYGGQVRTPEVKGKQYIGIYEEVLPETEAETEPDRDETSAAQAGANQAETVAPAFPAPAASQESTAEKILHWLREHLTVVTISAGLLLFLLAAGVLLWLSGKKDRTKSGIT